MRSYVNVPGGAMIGLASAATAATVLACWATPASELAIVIPAPQVPVQVPAQVPVPKPQQVPNPRASELLFVVRAGGESYVRLADVVTPDDESAGIAMPRHGRAWLSAEDGVQSALAPVKLADVPAPFQDWQGRTVKVDGDCTANVIGFAVVSRLTGDPGYAPGDLEKWTAASVMEVGAPMLVAKLDACIGTYARDATLSDVIVPVKLSDPALEAAGRKALLASEAAAETQRAWDEQVREVNSAPRTWTSDPDAVTAQVVRHPVTGETFVSVHGHVTGGCGDPTANVWGLFRVTGAHGDPLEPVVLRQLGELDSIDALLDVDGDGVLELLGKPWVPTAQLLIDLHGNQLDQLKLPFYGCPC